MVKQVEQETVRLDLPSGGWAEFRTVIKYGARRQLRRIGYRIGARAQTKAGTNEVGSVEVEADNIADMMEAQTYFPLVYLLSSWSYDTPLPTLQSLEALDVLTVEDGEFLLTEAEKRFEEGYLDTEPKMEEDPNNPSPFVASSA